jgi:predicted metal-dependent HD superfamily phosphohydrolase
MVKSLFIHAIDKYSNDRVLKHRLWKDIESRYSGFGRHYHTLAHLEHLANELFQHREKFINLDTIVFSIVYHDVIYNTLKKNNEVRSANYAKKNLSKISFPANQTDRCMSMILATKTHSITDDPEINLFMDADLSILGADQETYIIYTQQTRKEYFLYPDFMYRPGRRKVIEHFLSMSRIFKTDPFYNMYETQARKNLVTELALLKVQQD